MYPLIFSLLSIYYLFPLFHVKSNLSCSQDQISLSCLFCSIYQSSEWKLNEIQNMGVTLSFSSCHIENCEVISKRCSPALKGKKKYSMISLENLYKPTEWIILKWYSFFIFVGLVKTVMGSKFCGGISVFVWKPCNGFLLVSLQVTRHLLLLLHLNIFPEVVCTIEEALRLFLLLKHWKAIEHPQPERCIFLLDILFFICDVDVLREIWYVSLLLLLYFFSFSIYLFALFVSTFR